MPVIFIPYLAYRGRWRAAGYTALAAAALSLSPALVFGWGRFWEYVTVWRGVIAAGWGVGKMNQSVYAMWDRFIGHGMVPLTVAGLNDVPESGAPLVTAAVIVSLTVITVLALWIFRGPTRPDSWAAVTEWGVVFIVSAL